MASVASQALPPRLGRPRKQLKRKVEAMQLLRAQLLEAVAPVVIAGPVTKANLKSVAEQAGVSQWVLRRHFGGFEELLNAVWDRQIRLVVNRLSAGPPVTKGVQASIYIYASFIAGVMQSDLYRGLLLLLVRYGIDYPWLAAAYENVICQTVRRGLQDAIQEGGGDNGYAIVVNEFAVSEFHKKMETELATSRIIPPYQPRQSAEVSAIVAKIAADTFKATQALNWLDARPVALDGAGAGAGQQSGA